VKYPLWFGAYEGSYKCHNQRWCFNIIKIPLYYYEINWTFLGIKLNFSKFFSKWIKHVFAYYLKIGHINGLIESMIKWCPMKVTDGFSGGGKIFLKKRKKNDVHCSLEPFWVIPKFLSSQFPIFLSLNVFQKLVPFVVIFYLLTHDKI